MLMSSPVNKQTAELAPGMALGPGLQLRPDQTEEVIGTCPSCRTLLFFEISLAPDLADGHLEDPEALAQLFHKRGRPRKHVLPSTPSAARRLPLAAPELAKRLMVHDRKVAVQAEDGEVRLIHAGCGTPLQLFR